MANLGLDPYYLVENCDDHPVVFRWARAPYLVPPRARMGIPSGAIVNAVGDWRAKAEAIVVNQNPADKNSQKWQIPARQKEIDRLAGTWFREPGDPLAGNEPDKVRQRVPKIRVFEIGGEAGNEKEITLLLDDPYLQDMDPDLVANKDEYLRTQLIETQKKLAILTQQFQDVHAQDKPTSPESGVTEDTPPLVPTRRKTA